MSKTLCRCEDSLSLLIGRSAKALSRAFDDALAAVGRVDADLAGPARAVRPATHRTQGELAEAVGVRQPTLTHHLDGLERAGLVHPRAGGGNRRVQQVTVTKAGEHCSCGCAAPRRPSTAGCAPGSTTPTSPNCAGCWPSSRRTRSRTDAPS